VSDFKEEIADLPAQEKSIDVMAAVVEKDGHYLICRRPEHKRHGGLWEFPGGKVHDGEDCEQAMRRELVEELEVELSRFEGVLHTVGDPGSPFRIVFARVSIVGEPVLIEHTEMAWCSAEELAFYDLAPSDRRFVKSYFGAPFDDV
jgi:mutator protein MutT